MERICIWQVKDEFDLPVNGWRIWMNRQKTTELLPQKTKTLNSYKVRCVRVAFCLKPISELCSITCHIWDHLPPDTGERTFPDLTPARQTTTTLCFRKRATLIFFE